MSRCYNNARVAAMRCCHHHGRTFPSPQAQWYKRVAPCGLIQIQQAQWLTTTSSSRKRESPIFGQPMPNPKSAEYESSGRMPRTYQEWKLVLKTVWKDYRSTWDGFLIPKEKKKQEEKQENDKDSFVDNDFVETLRDKRTEVESNVKRNIEFVQKEGTKVGQKLQEETGISSGEDLKQWAGEQMKLASECLSEFMVGYRQGRDDEIDKMLHKYFQDGEDEEADTKKRKRRRKPKQRKLKR